MEFDKERIYTCARIGEIRRGKGWSKQKLADLADMERSSISEIEGGKTDFRFSTLCRIAEALGVKVSDLVR